MSGVNRSGEPMTPLSQACAGLGISEAEVLAHKIEPADGGESSVSIVTKGGRKLRWPADPQTTFVLRQMALEREDLAAAASIAAHREAIRDLVAHRESIAQQRHQLALDHQVATAPNAAARLHS